MNDDWFEKYFPHCKALGHTIEIQQLVYVRGHLFKYIDVHNNLMAKLVDDVDLLTDDPLSIIRELNHLFHPNGLSEFLKTQNILSLDELSQYLTQQGIKI